MPLTALLTPWRDQPSLRFGHSDVGCEKCQEERQTTYVHATPCHTIRRGGHSGEAIIWRTRLFNHGNRPGGPMMWLKTQFDLYATMRFRTSIVQGIVRHVTKCFSFFSKGARCGSMGGFFTFWGSSHWLILGLLTMVDS